MPHHGINLATTRIVSEKISYNSKFNTNKLMYKSIQYSLFFGILSAILLSLLAPFISKILLHSQVSSYLFYIIAISLPFISISSALNGYFTALRKNGKNAIARIFEQTIKIIATSYLLSFFMPFGLEYACLCLVLGESISEIFSCFFVFILYCFEKRKYKLNENSNENYIKSIFAITLPVSITSYIRSGLSSIKQLLIPLRLEKFGMTSNEAVSSYGLINGMALPVLMFPEVIINSFSGLLVPEFTYYYTKKNYERIRYLISKIFKLTLVFSICVIGIFLFYSDNINLIVYNNLEISFYLKILCPLLLFMYLDSIVDNILKGLNEQLGVMKCNILDLFVSIFCIYILLPFWGINGYIAVIFISEVLNSSISIMQLKHITNFKFDFKNWIVKPFLGIIFAYFITEFFIINTCANTFYFVLKIFFFVCSYFLFQLYCID